MPETNRKPEPSLTKQSDDQNLIGQPISKGEKDTGPYGDNVKVPEGKVQYTLEEAEKRNEALQKEADANQAEQVATSQVVESSEPVSPGAEPQEAKVDTDHPVKETSEREAPGEVKIDPNQKVRKTSEDPNPNASHDPADQE